MTVGADLLKLITGFTDTFNLIIDDDGISDDKSKISNGWLKGEVGFSHPDVFG